MATEGGYNIPYLEGISEIGYINSATSTTTVLEQINNKKRLSGIFTKCSDLPGTISREWYIVSLCCDTEKGNSITDRIVVLAFLYNHGSATTGILYKRDIYNGAWLQSSWLQLI